MSLSAPINVGTSISMVANALPSSVVGTVFGRNGTAKRRLEGTLNSSSEATKPFNTGQHNKRNVDCLSVRGLSGQATAQFSTKNTAVLTQRANVESLMKAEQYARDHLCYVGPDQKGDQFSEFFEDIADGQYNIAGNELAEKVRDFKNHKNDDPDLTLSQATKNYARGRYDDEPQRHEELMRQHRQGEFFHPGVGEKLKKSDQKIRIMQAGKLAERLEPTVNCTSGNVTLFSQQVQVTGMPIRQDLIEVAEQTPLSAFNQNDTLANQDYVVAGTPESMSQLMNLTPLFSSNGTAGCFSMRESHAGGLTASALIQLPARDVLFSGSSPSTEWIHLFSAATGDTNGIRIDALVGAQTSPDGMPSDLSLFVKVSDTLVGATSYMGSKPVGSGQNISLQASVGSVGNNPVFLIDGDPNQTYFLETEPGVQSMGQREVPAVRILEGNFPVGVRRLDIYQEFMRRDMLASLRELQQNNNSTSIENNNSTPIENNDNDSPVDDNSSQTGDNDPVSTGPTSSKGQPEMSWIEWFGIGVGAVSSLVVGVIALLKYFRPVPEKPENMLTVIARDTELVFQLRRDAALGEEGQAVVSDGTDPNGDMPGLVEYNDGDGLPNCEDSPERITSEKDPLFKNIKKQV